MKEGDYVRTIYGIKRIDQIICGQDVRFDNTDGFDEYLLNYHHYDGISINSYEWKEIVIGEPKEKPIDLIEIGDYVNGYKITSIGEPKMANCNKRLLYAEDEEGYLIKMFREEDIKSIVTKEQFENIKYEVKQ